MATLVTGAAGFIGHHVVERLASRGEEVIGVDDFNAYYDPALKRRRAAVAERRPGVRILTLDIADAPAFAALLRDCGARRVVHLAAQAGVRYSLQAPFAYERANVAGVLSVLEACRAAPGFEQLVYASSSSVYGNRPAAGRAFREDDRVDHPASLYAATKRAGELMCEAYSGLYGLPMSGLRFFTAYGPWGRPDMAYFLFTRAILAGEPIDVFGEGRMARDFTYVDDIVDGVMGVLDHPPAAGEHRLFNVGDSRPVALLAMIETLERLLGRPAEKRLLPMQPGDVTATYADISRLTALCGYDPKVTLDDGLARFVAWYRGYTEAG